MRHSTHHFAAVGAIWILALFGAGGVPHSAEAALIVVNSRSAFDALGHVTSVDWGVFGAGGTLISTPDSRTVGPLTVDVTSTQGQLGRTALVDVAQPARLDVLLALPHVRRLAGLPAEFEWLLSPDTRCR